MIKRIIPFVIAALLLSSCGNKSGKEVSSADKAVKVEFASLVSNPADYIDKNIVVEGKVVHVCRETGKKLFIVGENPDVRLYVQAGEEMPKFPMELLGSEIVVEGTLTQPVAAAMAEGEGMAQGEGMMKGEGMAKTAGADTCETAKALASQPVLSDLMMIYNKHSVVK